ncbi:MAG TPA: hemolysin family protein [Alphaproteobacteria bacterium]|jgi:CBS domain containing-hemolysin-like protein|nr:hemolysin family protein [Alphaproteobacteria bacterium]
MNDPDRLPGSEPGASFIERIKNRLRALLRGKVAEDSLRAAIEDLMEESADEAATIRSDEKALIANVLNLRDVTVDDVMVPRADIVAVEIGISLDELVQFIGAQPHSRIPVYRDTLDDVAGMVHIKDVLGWAAAANKKAFTLANLLRKVLFVAPSMPMLDLLLEMRMTRVHVALVVDEYGGVDGLVTIEDLVEEIVGEIEDEHDKLEVPIMIERPDGSVEASARTPVEDFESRFGEILAPEERDDIDTLGGLVFSIAGRVPLRGELVRHASGLEFEVLEGDPRRIRRLRIRNLPAPDGSSGAAAE